jgi:Superinfection immunity protein
MDGTGGSWERGLTMFVLAGPRLVILLLAFVLYWLPTIVAVVRRNELPSVGPVVLVNCFLGWTLVGWVVALAMASRPRRRR